MALGSVGSTQEEARRFARAGAPHGTIVIAEAQTAGRGRRGRTWQSPARGGLWVTVVLRGGFSIEQPQWLTLAAALAVCDSARALGVAAAEIKWPNDLVAGGRKCAGVLGELLAEGGAPVALLGLGVNVDLDPEALASEVSPHATALRREGLHDAAGREVLLVTIGLALDRLLCAIASGDHKALLAALRAATPSAVGRRVAVDESDGSSPVTGVTRGLLDDGALRLDTDDGRTVIVRFGGTLRFEPSPEVQAS